MDYNILQKEEEHEKNEKTHKDLVWIVAHIYGYLIGGNIFSGVFFWIFLKIIPIQSTAINTLLSLIVALITLYFATKWAVKSVFEKSIVDQSEFKKISFTVGVTTIILSIFALLLASFLTQNWSLFIPYLLLFLIEGTIVGFIYGTAVSFWLKRLRVD